MVLDKKPLCDEGAFFMNCKRIVSGCDFIYKKSF
jgi:hypothetical protein